MLTFRELLEQERTRANLFKNASQFSEVLEAARRLNTISAPISAMMELEERNRKLIDAINEPLYANLKSAVDQINASSAAQQAATAIEDSYKSILDSISPISTIYSSELAKLRAHLESSDLQSLISSSALSEAKKIQDEIARFDPDIRRFPITTLERALESNDKDAFEQAEIEVENIEFIERTRMSTLDIPLREKIAEDDKPIDIFIVTGVPFELRVFCGVFDVKYRYFSDQYVVEYYFGSVESGNRHYSVALAFGEDMGNFHASQVTTAAIVDLQPKLVISAGIGYTLNPCKLQLCDIHITDSIVYWGLTSKEYESQGRKVRAIPVRVKSNHMCQEVRKYVDGIRKGKTPFLQWVEDSREKRPGISSEKIDKVLIEIHASIKCGIPDCIFNERPQVEVGKTMVSDDAVIASIIEIKKRSAFDAGNENHISGEMEAAGVAMALANSRRPIEFIAIRGISDFGFGKEALENLAAEFRLIAATRVATFIRGFLQSEPSLPKIASQNTASLGKALTTDNIA
jgi:nucleoside phosphorylase